LHYNVTELNLGKLYTRILVKLATPSWCSALVKIWRGKWAMG
jgi:hypothetical protein